MRKTLAFKLDALLQIGIVRTATQEEINDHELILKQGYTYYCFEPFDTSIYDKIWQPCKTVNLFVNTVYNINLNG